MLKQKQGDSANPGTEQKTKTGDDQSLKDAAQKGKDILAKLDQATKKKSGRWVSCCGVRTWVED